MTHPYEKAILLGILAELDVAGDPPTGVAMRIVDELRAFGVRYLPACWHDRAHTNREANRFRLAVARLERAGQVERVQVIGSRTTHLRPTPAGIAAAVGIGDADGAGADVAAVIRALSLCEWWDPSAITEAAR